MGEVLEIRIHGRGGQGAQVACQILADAFFRSGRFVQAFAAYGGERRGAPVTAFVRVDEVPIRLRCDIERPHHAVVLDPTMLADPAIAASLRPGATLVVNGTPAAAPARADVRVVSVDASQIARRAGLGAIVSTALLGAFAAATGLVSLDTLSEAVEAGSPVKKGENVRACSDAFAATTAPGRVEPNR